MDLVAKIAVLLVTKLLTETFLSRLVIYSLAAWAKNSENKLDDKVVQAMADALGVPIEQVASKDAV